MIFKKVQTLIVTIVSIVAISFSTIAISHAIPQQSFVYDKLYTAIAHGSGDLDGYKRLNAVECVEYWYAKGTKLFEIDFKISLDNKPIALHDYKRFPGYSDSNRVPYDLYTSTKLEGAYTGLTGEKLADLIKRHPDIYFMIDLKETNYMNFYSKLLEIGTEKGVDFNKHIIPQLLTYDMWSDMGMAFSFEKYIFANYKIKYSAQEMYEYFKSKKIYAILIDKNNPITSEYCEKFLEQGKALYIHTLNTISSIKAKIPYGYTGFYTDVYSQNDLDELSRKTS